MDSPESLTDLAQRCQAGDRAAADRLFALYAGRLMGVAEQHLSRRVAAREDGEDVVQSVFRTFFRRHQAGDFRIDNSASLWRLLVKITVLKARAKGRHHTAEKRDVRAEAGNDAWLSEASARDPGPAEAAALVDLIETALRGLEPLHGQVLELLLQGQSVAEIAQQLGKTRQAVYRIRELLQQRLKRAGGEEQ
jgi:RNA polymerase sigma-70 factor, ECF subfamily